MKYQGIFSTIGLATALTFAAAPDAHAQVNQFDQFDMETEITLTGLIPSATLPEIQRDAYENGFQEWARAAEAVDMDVGFGLGYTAFIADDAAYQRIPAAERQAWMADPEGQQKAVRVSIVGEPLSMDDLRKRTFIGNLEGGFLPVRVEGDQVWIGNALVRGVTETDEGVIYHLDRVLLPNAVMMRDDPDFGGW